MGDWYVFLYNLLAIGVCRWCNWLREALKMLIANFFTFNYSARGLFVSILLASMYLKEAIVNCLQWKRWCMESYVFSWSSGNCPQLTACPDRFLPWSRPLKSLPMGWGWYSWCLRYARATQYCILVLEWKRVSTRYTAARAVALISSSDFLKERLFGLSNPQGNHGESIKECHFHLDNTPSVSLYVLQCRIRWLTE